MSKLAIELQKLATTAVIELFELDLTPDDPGSNNKYYFHAGTNEVASNIVWNTQEYTALPISVTGYERNMTGPFPRLKLAMANLDGMFTTVIGSFDDLLGSKLTRRRTFARFLDAVNFPLGNAEADPTVELPVDIFYGSRKVGENPQLLEMEFATRFETDGVMLPRRQVTANLCAWRLRDATCGFTGLPLMQPNGEALTQTPSGSITEYSDVTAYVPGNCVWYVYTTEVYVCLQNCTGIEPSNGAYWERTGCPKSLGACKTHHGITIDLPFGAFPGVAKLPVT